MPDYKIANYVKYRVFFISYPPKIAKRTLIFLPNQHKKDSSKWSGTKNK